MFRNLQKILHFHFVQNFQKAVLFYVKMVQVKGPVVDPLSMLKENVHFMLRIPRAFLPTLFLRM